MLQGLTLVPPPPQTWPAFHQSVYFPSVLLSFLSCGRHLFLWTSHVLYYSVCISSLRAGIQSFLAQSSHSEHLLNEREWLLSVKHYSGHWEYTDELPLHEPHLRRNLVSYMDTGAQKDDVKVEVRTEQGEGTEGGTGMEPGLRRQRV